MSRCLLLIAVTLGALPLMGQSCNRPLRESRRVSQPASGYDIVPNFASPVVIETQGLQGLSRIEAYATDAQWHLVFLSPEGNFLFNEPLLRPSFNIWRCGGQPPGREGCVAKLRIVDEMGVVTTVHPGGALYLCTEDYVQRQGRKHCGGRALQRIGGVGDPVALSLTQNEFFAAQGPSLDSTQTYDWQGDASNRLVSGSENLEQKRLDDWDPPDETQTGSTWAEYAWDPRDRRGRVFTPLQATASYDLGASWIFVPFEWKDRIVGDSWASAIGYLTAPRDSADNPVPNPDGSYGRGFAEILLDGMIENPGDTNTFIPNFRLWLDAVINLGTRADVSPELHFSIGPSDSGPADARLCIRQYLWARNELQSAPDAAYRWDQALLAGFLELLSIGDCSAKNISAYYCGTVDIDSQGRGRYQIVESSIQIAMAHYSAFKPVCDNQFRPAFKTALQEGLSTAGEQNLSDGMAQLTAELSGSLGIQVRRLVTTPSGMYLVTAETVFDPQYGVGTTMHDIGEPGVDTLQPDIVRTYGARGITRF